jgi:hypothetical protein
MRQTLQVQKSRQEKEVSPLPPEIITSDVALSISAPEYEDIQDLQDFIKNKKVAENYIFSQCPAYDQLPLSSATFRESAAALPLTLLPPLTTPDELPPQSCEYEEPSSDSESTVYAVVA